MQTRVGCIVFSVVLITRMEINAQHDQECNACGPKQMSQYNALTQIKNQAVKLTMEQHKYNLWNRLMLMVKNMILLIEQDSHRRGTVCMNSYKRKTSDMNLYKRETSNTCLNSYKREASDMNSFKREASEMNSYKREAASEMNLYKSDTADKKSKFI